MALNIKKNEILVLLPNFTEAMKQLQKYHSQWVQNNKICQPVKIVVDSNTYVEVKIPLELEGFIKGFEASRKFA